MGFVPLMVGALDVVGVFGLRMTGLFASISYVVGRIIGYAFMYWFFSLIQQVIPIIQIPTAPILLNIFILFMLLAARIGMSES